MIKRLNFRTSEDFSAFYLFASIIMWLITILWIIFIFRLSDENAADSSERSKFFLSLIQSVLNNSILTEGILRKIAHVTEFSLLSLLSFLSIRFTNMISYKSSYAESKIKMIKSDNELYILLSLWLSTLVAIFDEYHQLFVPGRSGSIIDVGIDLIGIIIVLLIIRIFFSLYLIQLGKTEVRYGED